MIIQFLMVLVVAVREHMIEIYPQYLQLGHPVQGELGLLETCKTLLLVMRLEFVVLQHKILNL